MVGYPAEFPTEALGTIMKVVADGSWETQKDEFAHAAWNVQGFLQSMVLPLKADDEFITVNSLALDSTLDDAEAVEALQFMVDNPPVSVASAGDVKAFAISLPLPAIILLKWLLGKLVEEIVQ